MPNVARRVVKLAMSRRSDRTRGEEFFASLAYLALATWIVAGLTPQDPAWFRAGMRGTFYVWVALAIIDAAAWCQERGEAEHGP